MYQGLVFTQFQISASKSLSRVLFDADEGRIFLELRMSVLRIAC